MSDFFSKTGSDTFRSVLIYRKEQESRKKCYNRAKSSSFWEGLTVETRLLWISRNLIQITPNARQPLKGNLIKDKNR